MSAEQHHGCDWFVRGERCDRLDLVMQGDGSWICTIHFEPWLEARRAMRARLDDRIIPSECVHAARR